MTRKSTNNLTPEEVEKRRKYNRDAKRESRAWGHKEKRKPDTRKRKRAAYMREYRSRVRNDEV